ncbi:MAG: helix-turn-helix transcriptional regulator [Firmicutes bacterium]|nr:helix-turn-helix transcriptional regulator [Bacillota bacterium]
MRVKVKEYRQRYNITQEELAKAVGVTRQTIISLENGKYNASLRLAHRLAVFFGTAIEDLFVFDEDE